MLTTLIVLAGYLVVIILLRAVVKRLVEGSREPFALVDGDVTNACHRHRHGSTMYLLASHKEGRREERGPWRRARGASFVASRGRSTTNPSLRTGWSTLRPTHARTTRRSEPAFTATADTTPPGVSDERAWWHRESREYVRVLEELADVREKRLEVAAQHVAVLQARLTLAHRTLASITYGNPN